MEAIAFVASLKYQAALRPVLLLIFRNPNLKKIIYKGEGSLHKDRNRYGLLISKWVPSMPEFVLVFQVTDSTKMVKCKQ